MNKPAREGFVDSKPVDIEVAAPAPEEPVQEEAEWPIVIKLRHKPIRGSGTEELHELVFREPTAADIMRSGGNPCRIEVVEVSSGMVTSRYVIDDRRMLTLMANLCGVLEPNLQRMDPRDYNSCAYRLQRFFLPEQGIW